MKQLTEPTFSTEFKTAAGYLDVAANAHGEEKGFLAYQALQRVKGNRARMVELGPGGGSAVAFLASRLAADGASDKKISLTLVEAPGVASESLARAMEEFGRVGSVELVTGFAQDVHSLVDEPVDVISASALMHEVYSYGGGYDGLRAMIRTVPTILRPGGLFAYRDVYAVDRDSLHERAVQTYSTRPWVRFVRMFLPQYLRNGTHPYHGAHDEVIVRQDSRIVPIRDLADDTSLLVSAPVGVLREVQRHYITLRDHAWRAGVLGFRPCLDGQLASDWINARTGHKRVHYTLAGRDRLPASQLSMLASLSERYVDHYTVDGDIFDECTDRAISRFLALAEREDAECRRVWEHWMTREGRETYAYMTVDTLLAAFAVSSTQAASDQQTVLMPVHAADVTERDRGYYNRYLRRNLPNPLRDAKQLVLFSNIPMSDSDSIESAMSSIQQRCSRANLARVYAAITMGA